MLVCVNHRHKIPRANKWNFTLTCISLVKDKPPSLSSPLSSLSTPSSSLSSRHTNIKRSQKTTKPLGQQESTFRDEERGKTILMYIFMSSFQHVPGDGLLFWSSIPSSSSRTTEIREPVTVVLWDTENRRVFCRLECVHKESVDKTCSHTRTSVFYLPKLLVNSGYLFFCRVVLLAIGALRKNTTSQHCFMIALRL